MNRWSAGAGQNEIHTDDEEERVRLEAEMKRATVNTQLCHSIGESITVLGVMPTGILFC